MTDITSAFEQKASKKFNNDLEYFFTQRKVIEYEEVLDKNMSRQKKKKQKTYNFLAINLPLSFINDREKNDVHIEIWGDNGYNYTGRISENKGIIPHLLIRLTGDSQIFIKLGSKNEDTVISFVQIPKRYQIIPNIENNKLQIDNNELEEDDV